jgi:sugar phosphate permease
MEAYAKQLKDIIGGLTGILIAAVGLFVIGRVIFGEAAVPNVIKNIQTIVDGFVGSTASLAGLVTLLIVLAIFGRK